MIWQYRKRNDVQQAILDNIPYLAWLKDGEGRYILVNQAFAGLYHTQTENIIGKTDFDLCTRGKSASNFREATRKSSTVEKDISLNTPKSENGQYSF